MRQKPLFRILFAGVIVAVLVATAAATFAAVDHVRSERDREERQLAGAITSRLAQNVDSTANRVEGVRGLFEATRTVAPQEFADFTGRFVTADDPLLFIAWNPRIAADRRAAFENRTDRPITVPGTSEPVRGAQPSFPVFFISRGFREHVGADPAAEQVRAAALRRAGETRQTQLSGKITLRDKTQGAIFVTPVYERRANGTASLRGYVTGAYDLSALAEGVLAGFANDAAIRISNAHGEVISAGGAIGDGAEVAMIDEAAAAPWLVEVDKGGVSLAIPAMIAFGGLLLAALVATTVLAVRRRESMAIAGRANAEGRLASLLARYESILAAAGEGIIGVDREGRATFVNPAAARLLRRPPQALLGRDAGAFFHSDAADEGDRDLIETAIESGDLQQSDEVVVEYDDGETVPMEHTAAPLVEEGETVGAVVSFRDITARRELEERTRRSLEEAEQRAAVDPLTGLANHRTFHERLSAEVERARRHGRELSLIVMDLDHFKLVNDTHGHQEGDHLLAEVARVMAKEIRAGELLARVGGEEFAMILPEADEMDAYQAAERIRTAVSGAHFAPFGRITLSGGVCGLKQAGDADRLYRLADGALYWAKNHGRDAVFRYSPEVVEALSAEERANRLQREQALMSIRILARAVDAKDPTTRLHSERVAELSAEIASRLGWPEDRLELLREAGLVHDVGKIGIPDAILFKPERLTGDEYAAVQQHAALGAQIVAEALSSEQISWVRAHHERWDGSGYPDNLAGFDIPEGARIMALADAWDTMITERPYKPPISPEDAVAECERFAGSQFWPAGVQALVATVGMLRCD